MSKMSRASSAKTGRTAKNAKVSSSPFSASVDEDEADFLRGYDLTAFPRPSVAVDVAVLTVDGGALRVALYRRAEHPGKGRYALPGGFVRLDESLDDAARRLLSAKAGLEGVFIEQLHTFGEPRRDPRGRIITVAYIALVDVARFERALAGAAGGLVLARLHVPWTGAGGGSGAVFVENDEGQRLAWAFDHGTIAGCAVQRLRERIDHTPLGFQLLPAEFTLRQLQDVHEIVRGTGVNKDSFRRRMLATGLLEPTGHHEQNVTWRPAELYRFLRRSAL
jgi:8-oxo-dGTP diphosphatase